ncbi:MAG TPA: HAD family phosphatase [Bryobacteraceae bacterium]|nr:HAD family phosphatase [Bryobacteraceae bacterium]
MRAVIFDYGNVLCQPQHSAEAEAMATIVQLPRGRFEEIYWRYRLAYDEGKLDSDQYWRNFGQVTPAQIDQLNRLDALSWTYPHPVMPDWARQLREAKFKIALLSNMPFTVRDAVLRCQWLPEFDQRTFSCELGISKPAPEIYEHCLSSLGIDADDALFIDDRPENVHGAEALGMHGLVFTSAGELVAQLAGRFDIPPPGIATLKEADEKDE